MEENLGNEGIERDESGFIAGTPYKSIQDLVKGHSELKGLHDKQANELGETRSQNQILAQTLKETIGRQSQPQQQQEGPNYGKEMAVIKDQLSQLDPMTDDFSKKQADLISKLTELTAVDTKEKVLSTASELFKKEMSQRDNTLAKEKFHEENPTFQTPEMQARIKQLIAKDKTGLHDPLSAFYQIQRDDEKTERERLSTENAEYMRRLNLARGTDSTGKVVTKAQVSPAQKTNQTKATGKDLDTGMMEALQKARGEV